MTTITSIDPRASDGLNRFVGGTITENDMQEFEVEINNEILGNSKHIMPLDLIAQFNLVAKALAIRCAKDGQEHSSGMWTVRLHTAKTEMKENEATTA